MDLLSTVASVLFYGFLLALVALVLWLVYRRRYRRIGPDEALSTDDEHARIATGSA